MVFSSSPLFPNSKSNILKYDNKKFKKNPVNNTFNLIGKRFTIMILYIMMTSQKEIRFNQLLNSVEELGPKTLSKRLKEMEKNMLIKRTVHTETPIVIGYSLTEKGKAVRPILELMAAFSIKYCAKDIFHDLKSNSP